MCVSNHIDPSPHAYAGPFGRIYDKFSEHMHALGNVIFFTLLYVSSKLRDRTYTSAWRSVRRLDTGLNYGGGGGDGGMIAPRRN